MRRQEIIDKILQIEALPASAIRVTQALMAPEASIADIQVTIESDPGLTANLLKVCNCALFAGRREIGSVHDAIIRLGMLRTLNIALAQAIRPITGGAIPGYELAPGELWRHSVVTALCAEHLAQFACADPAPMCFTAGLLHDVGKLVLGSVLAVDAAPILVLVRDQGIAFEEAEQAVLGIDHAEAGALLLEQWGLPPVLVQVARWHHAPDSCTPPFAELDLVHSADLLALGAGFGVGIDAFNFRLGAGALARLNVDAAALERTICTTVVEVAEMLERPAHPEEGD